MLNVMAFYICILKHTRVLYMVNNNGDCETLLLYKLWESYHKNWTIIFNRVLKLYKETHLLK